MGGNASSGCAYGGKYSIGFVDGMVEKFKQSALRLLDRLAKDSAQQSRKDGYNKIAAMLEDITDARAPWMADVLVGSVSGEHSDKLGMSSIHGSFQTD